MEIISIFVFGTALAVASASPGPSVAALVAKVPVRDTGVACLSLQRCGLVK
jgi:threonine/homoserine/homoserine lactone efflux protein